VEDTEPGYGVTGPLTRDEAAPDRVEPVEAEPEVPRSLAADPWLDASLDSFLDDFPPLRRSRAVRVVGIVTAASLLLATVGTTVGLVFEGPSRTAFSTDTALGYEKVTFTIVNAGRADNASCTVSVRSDGQVVGSVDLVATQVVGPRKLTLWADVPISISAFAGNPKDAQARCVSAVAGDAGLPAAG
jgi:hypothetical protein